MKKKVLIVIILLCSFLVRFWGVWFDLPYIYTTEEYKTVNYALKMGATRNLNPQFFNYPSLYLYFTLFISGIYFVVGKLWGIFSSVKDFGYYVLTNPTGLYIIMRTFSAIWSTGIVFLVYLIAKRLWSINAGIFAMLFIAFIPSIIESSHLIQPGLASVFLILTSFYFLICFLHTGKIKYYFLSGVISGLAISTFYYATPMFVVMVGVYWIHSRKITLNKNVIIGSLLVLFFFFLGTPYALLDFKTFIKDFFGHTIGIERKNILEGILTVLYNLLFVGNRGHVTNPWGPPFIGIISFLGIIQVLREKKNGGLFVLVALILFSIPVTIYHSSGVGYLFPAVPFFLLAGARFIDWTMKGKYKFLFSGLFFVSLIPSIIECVKIDYAYTLKDTRSIAKQWIEENIPSGSKVLVDIYAHSPQIKETKSQLERLYSRAVELNHYKKEYLKLQLDVHPGGNYGYEIYRIHRRPQDISGTIEMVKEAQKVQDLIDVSCGIDGLKKIGVQYIITNSRDEASALKSSDDSLKNLYESLPVEARLVKEFLPESIFQRGPIIRIYKLQ